MTTQSETAESTPEFDYQRLDPPIAEQVRGSTERIRVRLKKTLEDLIGIGRELQTVKEALDEGPYRRWLKAELGWTDRMARHYRAVARQFGQTEIISATPLPPTVAFLLAARSVPDEARQEALQRAQAGERLTVQAAKEIVTRYRKRLRRRRQSLPPKQYIQRLFTALDRQKAKWSRDDRMVLVQRLRAFADEIEGESNAKEKRP